MTRPKRWAGIWVRACVLLVAFATGCAAHSAARATTAVATPSSSTDSGGPAISGSLGVTPGDGPPGTVVSLHAIRCPPRGSKPDEIVWQDSSYPTKPGKPTKGGEELGHVVRTGNELQATFTVPTNAPAGVGFFETYCGVKSTGAQAGFTVDQP